MVVRRRRGVLSRRRDADEKKDARHGARDVGEILADRLQSERADAVVADDRLE